MSNIKTSVLPQGVNHIKPEEIMKAWKGKTVAAHTLVTAEENKTVWEDRVPVSFTRDNGQVTYFGQYDQVPADMVAYRDAQGLLQKVFVTGG